MAQQKKLVMKRHTVKNLKIQSGVRTGWAAPAYTFTCQTPHCTSLRTCVATVLGCPESTDCFGGKQ